MQNRLLDILDTKIMFIGLTIFPMANMWSFWGIPSIELNTMACSLLGVLYDAVTEAKLIFVFVLYQADLIGFSINDWESFDYVVIVAETKLFPIRWVVGEEGGGEFLGDVPVAEGLIKEFIARFLCWSALTAVVFNLDVLGVNDFDDVEVMFLCICCGLGVFVELGILNLNLLEGIILGETPAVFLLIVSIDYKWLGVRVMQYD